MPNWVRNRIQIFTETDEELNSVLNTVLNENDVFDFNKIIKRPEELNIEESSDGTIGLSYIEGKLNDFELVRFNEMSDERKAECIKLGQQYLDNYNKYGHYSWYGWSYDNWGTKWNACESSVYSNVIEFDTAWSAPFPIYEAMSKMFPNVEFEIMYADEDVGYNVGIIHIKNGEISYNQPEGGSKEALEIFNEVQGFEDMYVWDEETQSIKYIDEFEDEDEFDDEFYDEDEE